MTFSNVMTSRRAATRRPAAQRYQNYRDIPETEDDDDEDEVTPSRRKTSNATNQISAEEIERRKTDKNLMHIIQAVRHLTEKQNFEEDEDIGRYLDKCLADTSSLSGAAVRLLALTKCAQLLHVGITTYANRVDYLYNKVLDLAESLKLSKGGEEQSEGSEEKRLPGRGRRSRRSKILLMDPEAWHKVPTDRESESKRLLRPDSYESLTSKQNRLSIGKLPAVAQERGCRARFFRSRPLEDKETNEHFGLHSDFLVHQVYTSEDRYINRAALTIGDNNQGEGYAQDSSHLPDLLDESGYLNISSQDSDSTSSGQTTTPAIADKPDDNLSQASPEGEPMDVGDGEGDIDLEPLLSPPATEQASTTPLPQPMESADVLPEPEASPIEPLVASIAGTDATNVESVCDVQNLDQTMEDASHSVSELDDSQPPIDDAATDDIASSTLPFPDLKNPFPDQKLVSPLSLSPLNSPPPATNRIRQDSETQTALDSETQTPLRSPMSRASSIATLGVETIDRASMTTSEFLVSPGGSFLMPDETLLVKKRRPIRRVRVEKRVGWDALIKAASCSRAKSDSSSSPGSTPKRRRFGSGSSSGSGSMSLLQGSPMAASSPMGVPSVLHAPTLRDINMEIPSSVVEQIPASPALNSLHNMLWEYPGDLESGVGEGDSVEDSIEPPLPEAERSEDSGMASASVSDETEDVPPAQFDSSLEEDKRVILKRNLAEKILHTGDHAEQEDEDGQSRAPTASSVFPGNGVADFRSEQKAWEVYIRKKISDIRNVQEFNARLYGESLVSKLIGKDGPESLLDVVAENRREEICRNTLAALMLATAGNVEIINPNPTKANCNSEEATITLLDPNLDVNRLEEAVNPLLSLEGSGSSKPQEGEPPPKRRKTATAPAKHLPPPVPSPPVNGAHRRPPDAMVNGYYAAPKRI